MFRTLARCLGSEQPLIGVDPTLLEASEVSGPYRMEEVAACLAKQIRELQPDGPYQLGGICGGALIAYATASYLVDHGQQVEILALFEPHPSYRATYVEHSTKLRSGWIGKKLKFHIDNFRRLESKDARLYVTDHIRERRRVLFNTLNSKLTNLRPHHRNGGPPNMRHILGLAYRDYLPRPFSGRITLFQATYREPGGEWERQYWRELATEIAIHEVPGYSNWIVRFFVEPNVRILAGQLQSYLSGLEKRGKLTA